MVRYPEAGCSGKRTTETRKRRRIRGVTARRDRHGVWTGPNRYSLEIPYDPGTIFVTRK
jgi:hypothetical protein